MKWSIEFLEEARADFKNLDGSIKPQVLKGIQKVSQNPLPDYQGGYGKPLGNQSGNDLSGLMKIKFLKFTMFDQKLVDVFLSCSNEIASLNP